MKENGTYEKVSTISGLWWAWSGRKIMIYIAYGANLNKSAMRHRCPDATPIGSSKLRITNLYLIMLPA